MSLIMQDTNIVQYIISIIYTYWKELTSLGLIGLIPLLYSNRPKKINEQLEAEYIDYSTDNKWIQKTYEINWGRLPLIDKIFIGDISPNSDVEIYSCPLDEIDEKIPEVCHEEIIKSQKKVYIKNKEYYKKSNINKIRLLIKQPLSNRYKDNITSIENSNVIEINNNNTVKIINYIYELENITNLKKLSEQYEIVDLIRVDSSTTNFQKIYDKKVCDFNLELVKIYALINEIPPQSGGRQGQTRISLA